MTLSWRRSTALLLTALAAALALGASTASAAPREIAYGCDLDICVLDPDNPSAVVNLTNNAGTAIEEHPVWSPSGEKLGFVSRAVANTRNIFLLNPNPGPGVDTSVALQITHYENGYLKEFVWSPDGTRIAFVRGTSEGDRSVLLAATDGTTGTPVVVAEHGQHPSFSPDGSRIAYSYGQQVYIKNADGSGVATPLANGGGHDPVWSPDGSRIAFDAFNAINPFVDLHVVSASGGGTPVVVPDEYSEWTWPSFSADGGRIAYIARREGIDHLHVVNVDGSGDHPVEAEPLKAETGGSWSPDGSRLVFGNIKLNDPSTSADDDNEVYIANADGSGGVHSLTPGVPGYEPAWKPAPRVLPPPPPGQVPIPKTISPKYTWVKTGIPWKPGQVWIQPLIVACGDITCGANSVGTTKMSAPILPPHPRLAAASGKKKPKKGKKLVVAKGKTTIPAGKSKPLKMKLTKDAIAILNKRGRLKIEITVTLTAPGQKKRVVHHTVEVVRKAPAKKHKHASH